MHHLHSFGQALLGLLSLLALGFCLALGVVRYSSGNRNSRWIGLSNAAPSFTTPTGYDPNSETHKGGRISRIADAAILVRYQLVTFGASPASTIKVNPTNGTPIGIVDDTTDTLASDLTIPLNINLLGGCDRTLKVAINSTVTAGDFLIRDATTAGYAMTDPITGGATVFQIGRALQSGVAGQAIEFIPLPMVVTH